MATVDDSQEDVRTEAYFHTGLIQELVQVGVLVVRPRFLMTGPFPVILSSSDDLFLLNFFYCHITCIT